MQREHTTKLVISAMMISLATVLSEIKLDAVFGGGVTLFSMVPVLAIGLLFGVRWGFGASLAYSVIQLLFGLDNATYLQGFFPIFAMLLLDYILAYTVLGFAGFFKLEDDDTAKTGAVKVTLAAVVGCAMRYICHVITGLFIWNSITSTDLSTMEFPWGSTLDLRVLPYSLVYNGWYMAIELVLSVVALIALRTLLCKLRAQMLDE